MSTNTILIQDGRSNPAEGFEKFVDLDGLLASNSADAVRLSNDVDLEQISLRLPSIKAIIIEFPAYADGRGFSIARQLRGRYGFTGKLIAEGPLIPDQYSFALQCGFDAVKVDEETYSRQSETDWNNAMRDFGLTYQRGYAFRHGPAVSVFDARKTSPMAANCDDPYHGLSAIAAIRRAIGEFKDEIALVSSMGADSVVLLHLVSLVDKNVPVIFLDTGKHFRETLAYRDLLIDRLGLTNFQNIVPSREEVLREDADGTLNAKGPDACCDLRKVRPLERNIAQYKMRITGRKRYQTPDRKNMPILEAGSKSGKLNPLAYWSAKDVTSYMRIHDLPPHPMLALGYLSIGCQPCTTRVTDGEDPRAGRWRNNSKTECGIHYIDGKWVPIQENKTFEVF